MLFYIQVKILADNKLLTQLVFGDISFIIGQEKSQNCGFSYSFYGIFRAFVVKRNPCRNMISLLTTS